MVTQPDAVELLITDAVGVAVARRQARELARTLGFGVIAIEEIVLCVSELGNNLWQHAGGGALRLEPLLEPHRGLRIVATDTGPGIVDVPDALRDGTSSVGGLGSGLAAVQRLMDALEVASTPTGTRLEATRWRS